MPGPFLRIATLALLLVAIAISLPTRLVAQRDATPYFPPADEWARQTPEQAGFDAARLAEALAFARGRESTRATDFADQQRTFGTLLGSIPTRRAATNGVVIHKGYIVAEFGDTTAVDPTYSVAKSMLATVAGVAAREGRLRPEDPVARAVSDGGYASPHNAQVTWAMHLQQESEWEGAMWGKSHDFVGREAFGEGERAPRALQRPGTFYEYNDVRVNRFALSLLRLFGRPVPDVFRERVMDPIGASTTWKWVPYHNSYVEMGDKLLPSVSGGTRWGGGMWIHARDLARFGYLWLRGGVWGGTRILDAAFVKASLTPSAHGPDYGYLWWLNTRGKNFPGLRANVFGARGAGGNTVTISPDHDLVVVLRWHHGNEAEFIARVIAAMK